MKRAGSKEDLFGIQAGDEEIEYINDAYSHAVNARTASALVGIDGYSFDQIGPVVLLKNPESTFITAGKA
jgi:hypothetical protein